MKAITLPVTALRTALAGLSKVITKRVTLPELGCVRVRRHDPGQVDLTVTDLDRTAMFTMDTPDQSGAMTLLVPFEDLSNVAKTCGQADTITIEAIGKENASIRFPVGGQSVEHHCDLLPVEKFPVQPSITGESIAVPDALREAIHEALECASTDPTRLVLNGAFLDVSKDRAHYVVGTDGRHLFSSNSFAVPLAESLIIPDHKFLGWKGFNQDGAWKLKTAPGDKQGGPRVKIASNHWQFLSRTVDGNYPNWKAMLPAASAYNASVALNGADLAQVIQAAQQLPTHQETHQTIGLELSDHKLRILGKSKTELPWTKIEIAHAESIGPDMTLLLDRRLLLKALRFGLSRIEFIDEISPVKFSAGGRQMVVMPLRPNPVTVTTPPPSPRPAVPAVAATPSPPEPAEPPQNTTTMHNNHDIIPEAGRQVTPRDIATSRPPAPSTQGESKPSLETALVQIESIKTGFREAITGLTKLGDTIRGALREQKNSEKDLHGVRQTLRSLQGVRI